MVYKHRIREEKIVRFCRDLDIFGTPTTLNFAGEQRQKSLLGSTATVIFVVAMVAITMIEILNYIDKLDPTTTTNNRLLQEYGKIDLQAANFVPAILFFNLNDDSMEVNEINKHYTVIWRKDIWLLKETSDLTKKAEYQHIIENFDVVPCKQIPKDHYSYADNDETYNQLIPANALCPKINRNFTVQGKGSDKRFETLSLLIKPCSLNESECKSPEEINGTYLQFLYPSVSINPSNYKQPKAIFLQAEDFHMVDIKLLKSLNLKLRRNLIMDYIGINSQWYQRDQYVDVSSNFKDTGHRFNDTTHCSPEEVSEFSCSAYLEFRLSVSPQLLTNFRRYRTVIEASGAIGGSLGLLSSVLAFIVGIYLRFKRDDYIAKTVYPLLYYDDTSEVRKKYNHLSKDNEGNIENLSSAAHNTKLTSKNDPAGSFGSPKNKEKTFEGIGTSLRPVTSKVVMNTVKHGTNYFQDTNDPLKLPDRIPDQFLKIWKWIRIIFCCSCCKKSRSEKAREEMDRLIFKRNKAKALSLSVKENLDVVNLVKELQTLKVITSLILSEKHLDLIPLVGFKMWIKDRKAKIDKEEKVFSKIKKELSKKKCSIFPIRESNHIRRWFREDRAIRKITEIMSMPKSTGEDQYFFNDRARKLALKTIFMKYAPHEIKEDNLFGLGEADEQQPVSPVSPEKPKIPFGKNPLAGVFFNKVEELDEEEIDEKSGENDIDNENSESVASEPRKYGIGDIEMQMIGDDSVLNSFQVLKNGQNRTLPLLSSGKNSSEK